MFKTLVRTVPLFANHIVATIAIQPETCRLMVGIGCRQVFVSVATVAFGADHIIPLMRSRNVASLAVGSRVETNQREATLVMDFLYFRILDQPKFRSVTACAIGTNCLLVYIFMAFSTFCRRIRKNKRRMAFAATNRFVLPNQWEFCRVMIKVFRSYIIPIFSSVTITAL